ncbi:DNA-directed DNA polymerase, partial [Tanacetum coccineum]
MSLELADRSIQYPRGIIKNVLIKVDKFVLPIDFVILYIPEDSRVLIILGRPFLATARAMIDVFNKKITLRVGDDEVIFNVDQSFKRSTAEDDECYGVDDLDDTINAEAHELLESNKYREYDLAHLKRIFEFSIYKVRSRCRYDVSNVLDTVYWGFLGVGTTFDIFQKILFPYSLNTAYWSSWIQRIGSCFLRGL